MFGTHLEEYSFQFHPQHWSCGIILSVIKQKQKGGGKRKTNVTENNLNQLLFKVRSFTLFGRFHNVSCCDAVGFLGVRLQTQVSAIPWNVLCRSIRSSGDECCSGSVGPGQGACRSLLHYQLFLISLCSRECLPLEWSSISHANCEELL